ncbi:hypothetical protein ACQKII_23065 [Lysinibacillus sp. NPDC048646]|uniref:hypothetical protein n=1 Tax=Lysinibacillus sp. NPDC048646 TaxID=3390574 RepID=UPI003D087513
MEDRSIWDTLTPTEVYEIDGTTLEIYGELDVEVFARELWRSYSKKFGDTFLELED